jgi:hypothetical protein
MWSERALRFYLGRRALETSQALSGLTEVEAMQIANEELHTNTTSQCLALISMWCRTRVRPPSLPYFTPHCSGAVPRVIPEETAGMRAWAGRQ